MSRPTRTRAIVVAGADCDARPDCGPLQATGAGRREEPRAGKCPGGLPSSDSHPRRRGAAGLLRSAIFAAAIAASGGLAHAADKLDLTRYRLTGNHAIAPLGGLGLEASAVTFARDRNALFVVGDEGMGVVELTLTGQTLSTMQFSAWPSRTQHNDAEGLTYLGNGVLAVAEERLQDAFRFTYVAGGSVSLATAPWSSISDYAYNNSGIEGLSFDPRNGSFVAVKQANPQEVRAGAMTFETGGGASGMAVLFNASLLGLNSLSDVQTLAPVDSLAGTAAADHLLILSLDSRKLVESDRSGNVMSHFDLSGVTSQAIEGVTVDHRGIVYLVAEDSGTGSSRLFVLTPVPEPGAYALLLAGLGIVALRRLTAQTSERASCQAIQANGPRLVRLSFFRA